MVTLVTRRQHSGSLAPKSPQHANGRAPISTTKPVEALSDRELATALTECAWRIQAAILLDIPNSASELKRVHARLRDLRNERARRWGMKAE
jgi:hypothetical protein